MCGLCVCVCVERWMCVLFVMCCMMLYGACWFYVLCDPVCFVFDVLVCPVCGLLCPVVWCALLVAFASVCLVFVCVLCVRCIV